MGHADTGGWLSSPATELTIMKGTLGLDSIMKSLPESLSFKAGNKVLKELRKPQVVARAFNPNPWETETRASLSSVSASSTE